MSDAPYLGLDIGLRRTGVALSETGTLVRPLTVVPADPPHYLELTKKILALAAEYTIATLVIGTPSNEDGSDTAQAAVLDEIATKITEAAPNLAVVRVNEFNSTQDGLVAFPDADKDAAAAAIILQSYLEDEGTAW